MRRPLLSRGVAALKASNTTDDRAPSLRFYSHSAGGRLLATRCMMRSVRTRALQSISRPLPTGPLELAQLPQDRAFRALFVAGFLTEYCFLPLCLLPSAQGLILYLSCDLLSYGSRTSRIV